MLLAIEDIGDRLQEVGAAWSVCFMPRSAELQITGGVLGIRVDTQDEYRGLRATGADLRQDREGVLVIGKADIENHEMPRLRLDSSQGFFGGFGLAKDDVPELLTEHRSEERRVGKECRSRCSP